jgi:hypothetical protein
LPAAAQPQQAKEGLRFTLAEGRELQSSSRFAPCKEIGAAYAQVVVSIKVENFFIHDDARRDAGIVFLIHMDTYSDKIS